LSHRDRLHRLEVGAQGLEVFRFIHCADLEDPGLISDFECDRARGKRAYGRASRLPELLDGMSVFRSLDLARRRWAQIASNVRARSPDAEIKIGSHIARVRLGPGLGLLYEDLGEDDGHMTLWGPPELLASAVAEIVAAEARI